MHSSTHRYVQIHLKVGGECSRAQTHLFIASAKAINKWVWAREQEGKKTEEGRCYLSKHHVHSDQSPQVRQAMPIHLEHEPILTKAPVRSDEGLQVPDFSTILQLNNSGGAML